MFIGLINRNGELIWNYGEDSLDINLIDKKLFKDVGIKTTEKIIQMVVINEKLYELWSLPINIFKNKIAIILLLNKEETEIESLKQENKLFTALFNVPYEGFIYVDANGIIQMVNDAFCMYLNMEKEDLLGHKLDEYKIDPNLLNVIETKKPDYLTFYPDPKLIASRQPVIIDHKVVGALGRYGALDLKCIRRNILDADEYIDIISRLQARDILVNVNQFMAELNCYREEFDKANLASNGIQNIKGNSPIMQALRETIQMIGFSPSSVLITGESWTGKELFAQAIHFHGERSEYPFVKVNCAAIPENLLESELFGYVEGAFTGARKGGKMGKFELANQGTIFLDEIGDMPISMQAKLLRVLQEREIERVGGDKTIPIDVRIISATNSDLKDLINEGLFRPDLYYRLNVVHLHIPPLRERGEDIEEIVWYAVKNLNIKLNRNITKITPDTMDILTQYDWPGNVRELVNVLETAMNFCYSNELDVGGLPIFLKNQASSKNKHELKLSHNRSAIEKQQVQEVLKQVNGNRIKASSILGISRTTLYRLMKKHELL